MRNHPPRLIYDNATSTWDEAMPLGNGRFGAMVYLEQDRLVLGVNHFDVYYRILWQYAHRPAAAARVDSGAAGQPTVEEIARRAIEAHDSPSSPAHNNYTFVTNPSSVEQYGVVRKGNAHPLTAELAVVFNPSLLPLSDFRQVLDLEAGRYLLEERRFTIEVFITSDDILAVAARATGCDPLASVLVRHPDRRLLEKNTRCAASGSSGASFSASFYSWGEERSGQPPFTYRWFTHLYRAGAAAGTGGCAAVEVRGDGVELRPRPGTGGEFLLLSSLWYPEKGDEQGVPSRLDQAAATLASIREAQARGWREFWSHSSISLPDALLERLWYLNLYSLACSSGAGAVLHEQACGLNGLWDIRQPSQWGSMWYWDVNIEESFWPIFTANHLELAKAFTDGLLSHVDAARGRAREVYHLEGIAGDYPFSFYFCIWPWCAQVFWWYYAYSGDEPFLREKAYPLFKEILRFYQGFMRWDAGRGQYDLFPDVSPEQGPMTKNSTISIACIRYLLRCAIRSAEILAVDTDERQGWDHMASHLPPYAIGESARFGAHLKDSEWADPDIFMAHSSPLMPIYPIGELDRRGGGLPLETLRNTLRWMESEQALGTHNFGWLACAWARLGDGDKALEMLLDKGVAFQMRVNGLFAEQTERWLQDCLTACEPVYNPPLIEAGSALAAAVNEMLLQSHRGAIDLFPAMPRGELAGEASRTEGRFDSVLAGEEPGRGPWREAAFRDLRAPGGFLVSAALGRGAVSSCSIRSTLGGEATLFDPFPGMGCAVSCDGKRVNYQRSEGRILFATEAGSTYTLAPSPHAAVAARAADPTKLRGEPAGALGLEDAAPKQESSALSCRTPARRRAFLGKDRDTDFLRSLDAMTFDYYAGDQPVSPISVWRLDFSRSKDERPKNYRQVLERQFHGCGKMGLDFLRVGADTAFTSTLGYGWSQTGRLTDFDRGAPDPLRRDGIEGDEERTFFLELPRGLYKILVISGDQGQPSFTAVRLGSGAWWQPTRHLRPGEFSFPLLPVLQPEDGMLPISFRGGGPHRWKLNALIVNRAL